MKTITFTFTGLKEAIVYLWRALWHGWKVKKITVKKKKTEYIIKFVLPNNE